jgi:hypothetical protein
MLRTRALSLALVLIASPLACAVPAGPGGRVAMPGPYAVGRTTALPPADRAATILETHTAAPLRETRRMCDLRGGRGSC